MEALANVNQFGMVELREDELMMVDGGLEPITTTIAVAGLLLAACTAAYNKGKDDGKRQRHQEEIDRLEREREYNNKVDKWQYLPGY
ncbi:class IIb bacteriocin, lactobin A/cerein 7B family [Natronospora cellulosivora (SeqCode)]